MHRVLRQHRGHSAQVTGGFRMSFPKLLAAGAVVLLAGCAGTSPRTPVSGTASDVALLAGEWNGDYWGGAHGRSGAITFHLEAGTDTAHGQVTMISNAQHARPALNSGATQTPAPMSAQSLAITFVHAEGGGVSGSLDPYEDPDCHCTAHTTFMGRIKGDAITGTFTTTHDTGGGSVT